ncbi:MAG: hypothetical protein HY077_15625 [Elusimicrobia bacterium]|nr:hypothetical protein [Elusimicrobiota bacterium]
MRPLLSLLLCAAAASSWGTGDLKDLADAQRAARVIVAPRAKGPGSAQRLEALRRSASALADRLEAPVPGAQSLSDYSSALRARLSELRRAGGLDPALAPVLPQLDALYASLPLKSYAREFAGPLSEAIAQELREASRRSLTEPDLLARLRRELVLPDDLEASFTEGISVADWVKLGLIKRFLYKHRLSRPKTYATATPAELKAGALAVEVGVETSGTVSDGHRAHEDQDWCFTIGGVEMEIPPEWILSHPKLHLPAAGETVKVRGWTYYDNYHDDEIPGGRPTAWEIHPAQDVEVLKPAAPLSAGTAQ